MTIQIIDDFIAPACTAWVEVLYQDNDLLLINKPSGLLSLSGKNPLNWDSLHYRLVNGQAGITPAFPTAKLLHRLDFGTSGIMLVGLNDQAVQRLNQQFQAGNIKKRYWALLEGWLAKNEGVITAPIAKDKSLFPKVKICHTTGKAAITEYKVLARLEQPQSSWVEFMPLTGRTHQLRIHSQFIGHSILGCDLYKSDSSQALAPRLLLHASDLYFEHPTSGAAIHGQCIPPTPFN